MILTVTLNPCIDKTIIVEKFSFNEVVRAKSSTDFAGGKGINVSRIIKIWGGETLATGFLGGSEGEWIKSQLYKEKIQNDFVPIKDKTRTNLTILDIHSKKEIHIVQPGPSITNKEVEVLIKKLKRLVRKVEIVVFSGSVPRGIAPDIYARLIRIVKKEKEGIITVLDTSGEPLRYGFEEKPFIVKPNAEETEFLVGEKINSLKKASQIIKFFLREGIRFPIISMGKKGIVASYKGEIYEAIHPKIKSLYTVGSGDSFLGGILFAFNQGRNMKDSLKVGVSCGIANSMTKGTDFIKKSDINRFYKTIKINNVD